MLRAILVGSLVLVGLQVPTLAANPITGKYVEARTCQVYTGPCFANGEVGLAGKQAIMTWRIDNGSFDGVDLAGHSAAAIVKTSHTLGFKGLADAETIKAILIVDSTADARQENALKHFVFAQTGLVDDQMVGSQRADIDIQFDVDELTATVEVGGFAHLEMRKARKGDCICSNESAYYPPLTQLLGSVPGVTIEGDVKARRLGTRWSIPDSRTAYLGLFSVDSETPRLAGQL